MYDKERTESVYRILFELAVLKLWRKVRKRTRNMLRLWSNKMLCSDYPRISINDTQERR